MTPLAVDALEGALRARNRILGIGIYPNPMGYFGPGGLEESEAACAGANRDLLAFLRPAPGGGVDGIASAPARTLSPRHVGRRWRFDSPLPSGDRRNDRVELRVLRPRRRPAERRVIVFHHPLYQKRWLAWEWFLADVLERFPVAMLAAPYHLSRIPAGQFAGEGTVNPNPWRLFTAIRQWCADQAAALRVLREVAGLEPVAVAGYSLGAFQSILASAAGVLDLPLAAIASTNRYAFGVHEGVLAHGLRKAMEAATVDRARLERMTESLQAERWAPQVKQPVLWIHGRWDRVDPPPSGERLEAALRPARSVHLDSGHATVVFERRRVGAALLEFLSDNGVS